MLILALVCRRNVIRFDCDYSVSDVSFLFLVGCFVLKNNCSEIIDSKGSLIFIGVLLFLVTMVFSSGGGQPNEKNTWQHRSVFGEERK